MRHTETSPRGPRPSPFRGRALLAGGLGLATLWAGAATYGLVFRDDALGRLLSRQSGMQAAYEARIGELGAEIELGRRKLDERTDLERRLSAALERQAELERRQSVLGRLPGLVPLGEVRPAPDAFELRGEDGPRPERRVERAEARLAGLEARLDAVQAAQARALGQVVDGAARTVRHLRGVIRGAGVDPARLAGTASGIGGPLVPLPAGDFSGMLEAAQAAVGEAERLRRRAEALPLRSPVTGPHGVSSGFGARLDPFTRGLALHTGLDLKAEIGEPARATAPGRVTAAEFAGGYGNMVEIDHGHGLSTRYAHLARIAVVPGQWMAAGAIVGRVGSTGRSTGAHLHYETRIDGEPVDPERFLAAGRELAAPSP
ncbi:M23 family metallopeptidase [Methylobacterium radiodurans]|uniref:Peptidase M23 n=1 Tax=Methylobacterium radiodurans TaxID=2202828 RepID=A0A2U8VT59_9HYPH|nr:M23 family metallopeptidase [Methylobacterium radiodurans]AWN36979.1 peptidase M23 [Methylobacterium radiodurans]